MIRSKEATGKTVEEARAAACAALGVNEDDLNVSYEILEMPQSTGLIFKKKTPAKVRVTVEEEDPAPAAPEKPAVKAVKPEPAEPAEQAEQAEPAQAAAEKPAAQPQKPEKAEPAAPAPAVTVTAAPVDETPVPIDIEANPKVKAAVDYLKEIVALMGVENVTFSAIQKGEATIIRLDGDKMGALIGRRGETMESLSYLASLVANRMEGDYIKLGLDVAGYRGKRENDLTALAQKIGQKVRRSGRCFSMEPMNPYERRIIHTAVQEVEGAKSWSEGEDLARHVVIGPEEGERPQRRSNYRGGNRRGGPKGGQNNRRSHPSGNRSHPQGDRKSSGNSPKRDDGDMPLYGRIDRKV